MKIRNSLKSLKDRHRDNRVIRRRGRTLSPAAQQLYDLFAEVKTGRRVAT